MNKYEELQQYLKQNQYSWLVTGAAGFIGSKFSRKTFNIKSESVMV